MLDIYLIIILSLIISYSPFIKKILLQTFTLDEVIFLEHLFFTIPLILYMVYMVFFTKKKLGFIKKLSVNHICYIVLMTITSIIGGFLYYFLINHMPMTKVAPILSPLIIIFTVLIGIGIFKEKLYTHEIIGIILIIIGIYITKSTICKNIFNK